MKTSVPGFILLIVLLLGTSDCFSKTVPHHYLEEITVYKTAQDDIKREELVYRVRKNGSVAITVYFKIEGYSSETAPFLRVKASKKHAKFRKKIWGMGYRNIRYNEGSRRVSLTADEETLLRIFKMDIVDTVTRKVRFGTF